MADDNWGGHRSPTFACATCMWFKRRGNTKLGRCRALPPGNSGRPGWPAVFKDDWCAFHKMEDPDLIEKEAE